MAENKPFEIPTQVRELAEKNIDQARKFYDQWMEGISQVMNMWSSTPAGEMVPGFDSLRERAIKFAKDNAEAAFAQAEKLAQAKDVQDLMTLQSHYAQAQMRSYATQAQELGRDDNGHAKHAVTQALTQCRLRCDAPSAMSAMSH